MYRSRSAPVATLRNNVLSSSPFSTILRVGGCPTCCITAIPAPAHYQIQQQRRLHSYDFNDVKNPSGTETSSRDVARNSHMSDNNTGDKLTMSLAPDAAPVLHFNTNVAEQISIPEYGGPSDRQARYEQELRNNGEVSLRQKQIAPGEPLKESPSSMLRTMQENTQDIDGLPWEVRWKKQMIPTHEEGVQDLRDRFELFEPDAIAREELWYLHWKDRGYTIAKDRLIWPQGYTDHLEHFDEHGRRRVLPSDQKWSSASWKHLADAQYKDRMFLIDKHERRVLHESLQSERVLAQKDEAVLMEQTETIQGMIAGVIDLNPDQAYHTIAGTSDPVEVAEVKKRTQEYQALSFSKAIRGNPEDMDPVTGLPKSNAPLLKSGMSVEEASLVATAARIAEDELQFQSLSDESDTGKSGIANYLSKQLKVGKSKDKPMLTALAEEKIEQIKNKKERVQFLEEQRKAFAEMEKETIQSLGDGSSATAASLDMDDWSPIDSNIAANPSTTVASPPKQKKTTTAPTPATTSKPLASGFISIPKNEKRKTIVLPPDTLNHTPGHLEEVPEWYQQMAVDTQPMIASYGLTNDPLETMDIKPAAPSSQEYNEDASTAATTTTTTTAEKQASIKARTRKVKKKVISSFYDMPVRDEEHDIIGDNASQGVSSFDSQRVFDEKMNPESSGNKAFKPLPMYKEVSTGGTAADDITTFGNEDTSNFIKDLDNMNESMDGERRVATIPDRRKDIYKTRQERADSRRRTNAYDPDLLLPDLPWETDSVMDPYRGVTDKDAVPFVREDIKTTWYAYRGTVRQMMAEIINFSKQGNPEAVKKMVVDSAERIRKGHVGDHPVVAAEIISMISHIFEANFVYFEKEVILTEKESVEASRLTTKADELNRQGIAKAKLLGPSYVDFVTEMAAVEVDELKDNPLKRRSVIIHIKGLEKFVQPFLRWIQKEIEEFKAITFSDPSAIKMFEEGLAKAIDAVRTNVPQDANFDQNMRKQAIGGTYRWCRGVLAYTTGSHYMRLMRHTGEAVFRAQAEDTFNIASEYFQAGFSMTNGLLSLPVPNSDPVEHYSDKEFPLGQNPINFEALGDFEKADESWGIGSTKRWYGAVDETEVALYLERRGRFQSALDAADRTMEYLQKKTHPSIHPFPDRARFWLEDAPLTQETAEHLWLRNMASIYLTFADLHSRQLRLKTAADLRKKGLNCLSTAVGAASERLPPSWRAPLLTKVIFMMNSFDSSHDPHLFLKDAEYLIDQMYAIKDKTRHWIEPTTRLHYRVAMVESLELVYASIAQEIARQKTQFILSDEMLMKVMQMRLEGRSTDSIPGIAKFDAALQAALEHTYRAKIRKYMSLETKNSEPYVALTHLYFNFRVREKNEEEIDKLWNMYNLAWESIYTQCCFGESHNGINKLGEGLKYLCHISFYGNVEQKKRLLEQLVRVRDKLKHLIQSGEMERCIASIEKHLIDLESGKISRTSEEGCIYVYSLKTVIDDDKELRKIMSNPVLTMRHSEEANYQYQQNRRHEMTVGN